MWCPPLEPCLRHSPRIRKLFLPKCRRQQHQEAVFRGELSKIRPELLRAVTSGDSAVLNRHRRNHSSRIVALVYRLVGQGELEAILVTGDPGQDYTLTRRPLIIIYRSSPSSPCLMANLVLELALCAIEIMQPEQTQVKRWMLFA